MFNLKNGTLSMENHDLDHIQNWIDGGDTPKEALERELDGAGLKIKDVYAIELNETQMRNKSYVELYSKIVCDFWNK